MCINITINITISVEFLIGLILVAFLFGVGNLQIFWIKFMGEPKGLEKFFQTPTSINITSKEHSKQILKNFSKDIENLTGKLKNLKPFNKEKFELEDISLRSGKEREETHGFW